MKTKLIFMLSLIITSALANDDKYANQMAKNIEAVYKAQTSEEFQAAINSFERIGNAEKTKWEPFYYASFGYIMQATREQAVGKKDQYLDLAASQLDKAKAVKENESEIVALEGFIHMIRVTVDPATRGQKYSSLAFQSFGKAIGLNPENPRALVFMAQMQYGTAQFFKSSTEEACATLTQAIEKFASFKTDNPLAPQWGISMANGMKGQCQ
jgi:tetratricopeptide (TPR) repeat protein